MQKKLNSAFMDFVTKNPTAYHVVDTAYEMLSQAETAAWVALSESRPDWQFMPGAVHAVCRNDSTAAFFRIPEKHDGDLAFRIAAVHTDSPAFKLKANPEIFDNGYIRLNVEGYGGMIRQSWFDRPLSIAGRVFMLEDNDLVRKVNVDLGKDLKCVIPSLAIHMSRGDEPKGKISIQKEMLPIIGQYDDTDKKSVLMPLLEKHAMCEAGQIVSHDLFLYDTEDPHIAGADHELLLAPRLDDQACVFSALHGFFNHKETLDNVVPLLVMFNNEEVGSNSLQGADSDFLPNLLERICIALGMNRAEYMASLANSFMVSADNAHAAHPAYMEKADIVNRPVLNKGIVLKHASNQHYCTDGASAAIFCKICKENDIPYQFYYNNSDVAGGSTLGNIVLSHTSVFAVDIGIPQLSMHSAYECCGTSDIVYMADFFKAFFQKVRSPEAHT